MDTLVLKLISDAKAFFGLNEEATTAELHEAILAASPAQKDDAIIDMATEIASLVKSETEKQVSEFTAKLETDYKSIIETMEAKVSALETKLAENKTAEIPEDLTAKFAEINASIEGLKTEFGTQLNEVKARKDAAPVPGDGTIITKHETKETPLPSQGKNLIRL